MSIRELSDLIKNIADNQNQASHCQGEKCLVRMGEY